MEQKKEAALKLIILYKTLWGITEIFLTVSFYSFLGRNMDDPFTVLAATLGLNPENWFIGPLLEQAGSIDNSLLYAFTVLLCILGIFNLIEAWGLHKRYRWAEWLTVIATSVFIPYELYHVALMFGAFKLAVLVINVLIVYYLAKHKELFKNRKEAALQEKHFP